MFAEYGVATVLAGHSEMFERSYVDINGDGQGINYYDVGIAGDGLRGERRFNGNLLSEPYLNYNPFRAWTADRDEPEYWDGEVLLDGGKHYGHLEVNIEPSSLPGESARMTLSPVYSFPLLNENLEVLGTERRVYDDEVIVVLGEDGTVIADTHSGLPGEDEDPDQQPTPAPTQEPTGEPTPPAEDEDDDAAPSESPSPAPTGNTTPPVAEDQDGGQDQDETRDQETETGGLAATGATIGAVLLAALILLGIGALTLRATRGRAETTS